MAKRRRRAQEAKFARLRRHMEVSNDPCRSRRARTRAARYAAALAEQLGLLARPRRCAWCHRRQKLQRHHWDYDEPLNVTFLCADCHAIADPMALRMRGA
jgi:hypothetical protein